MSTFAVRRITRGVIAMTVIGLWLTAAQTVQPLSSEGTSPGLSTGAAPSAAREWRAERLAGTYPGDHGNDLAVAADGAAVVVWSSLNRDVWVKRFVPGQGWTKRRRLGHGSIPRVAMNDRGDIAVVWDDYSRGTHLLRVSTRPREGGWRAATLWRGVMDDWPQVAVGSTGTVTVAVAARTAELPARTLVFTHVRRWSGPRILSAPGARNWATRTTRVVSGPGGDVIVAWTKMANGRHHRVCASVSRAGGWGRPQCWRTNAVAMMEMSADDRGRVYVFDGLHLWSGGPDRVWVRERAPSARNASALDVDAAGNGHVVVMWALGCGCSDWPAILKVSHRRRDGGWSSLHTLPGMGGMDAVISRRGTVTALMNQGEYGVFETLVVTRKRPGSPWETRELAGDTTGFQIKAARSGVRALWREGYEQGSLWTARGATRRGSYGRTSRRRQRRLSTGVRGSSARR